jgi:hypothetical protein
MSARGIYGKFEAKASRISAGRMSIDVDTPSVVLARHVGRLLTSVAVEVGERACLLLDNVNPNTSVISEIPPELIAIIDIEFTPNPGVRCPLGKGITCDYMFSLRKPHES